MNIISVEIMLYDFTYNFYNFTYKFTRTVRRFGFNQ